MKKTITTAAMLLAILLVNPFNLLAQYSGEGTIDISAGIGLVSGLPGSGGVPIALSGDYGLNENVSVGGVIAFASNEERYSGGIGWDRTHFIIGVTGSYHHSLVEGVDTYGGLMLGYNSVSVSRVGSFVFPEPDNSGLVYQIYVGGNYFFTPNFGAYAELGYGVAIINLGVTYRL